MTAQARSAPYFAAAHLPNLFTAQEARAAGMGERDLRNGRFRRLFRGAYITGSPSYAEQVAFALRVVPAASFAAQHSAARLHGGTAPPASHLHVGTRFRHKCNLDGVRMHFYTRPPELTLVKGVPATSPAQTFLDLARCLEFVDLLILGDSLVRWTATTPHQIQRFVADASTHGARQAREVAALISENVDSPNETRLRLLMLGGGLPTPAVNREIRCFGHAASRRMDLALEEWKLGVEFDGRHHIERTDQWERDILRREELESAGWRFVIVTSSQLYAEPGRVLQRIAEALELAGAPRIRLKDDWRRHFA